MVHQLAPSVRMSIEKESTFFDPRPHPQPGFPDKLRPPKKFLNAHTRTPQFKCFLKRTRRREIKIKAEKNAKKLDNFMKL